MFICTALTSKEIESRTFKRLENFVHKTHIIFENLSNINGDILQKAWGFKIGKDGDANFNPILIPKIFTCNALTFK